MQKTMKAVRLSLIYGAALLLISSYPLSAMAEAADTSPATTTTTTPETTQTTPAPSSTTTTPTTSTANTTSPTAPATTTPASTTPTPSTTTPIQDPPAKPKETYTYNAATGHWDSNIWQYNPTTGKYEHPAQPVQTTEPAASPTVVSPNTTTPTGTTNNTGTQPATTTLTDTTKNAITSAINSGALTGNADVKSNTLAGNATSGNAAAAATIINNVNSTVTNSANQKAATFVDNVMGDVNGDILLQPMLLKAMLEAGSQTPSSGSTTATNTNQLTNNINLGATSGNATVSGNTTAGNATTGSANTVANVLNIVNSMVAANQSFVGTINIYGNLDGDILVAPDFIAQMLANNGNANTQTAAPTKVSSEDTQSIVNNVALAAQSGKAVVADNTSAGSATTGRANTNVVLFNLTGHDIVASNSLLVFVNVLGKWVGVIVDAPAGATAAAIGNGVTTNTVAPDLVINAATNTQLTNNINLTSQSGDAIVTDNTRAGSATSGNATASANIGNIVGTQMGLTGWFGILFINVFGSWTGSFGIDTPAGNSAAATSGNGPAPSPQSSQQPMRVIEFIPHNGMAGSASRHLLRPAVTIVSGNGGGGYTATNTGSQPTATLTSASQGAGVDGVDLPAVVQTLRPVSLHPASELPWLAGATFLVGLSLVGASTLSDARKRAAQLK